MKLADLRKQLRRKPFGRPVDELDAFLMEKGTMARPDPVDVSGPIKGRHADVVIIDDPIADRHISDHRADFRSEVLGDWVKEPADGDLPPTLAKMLEAGDVTWDNSKENRIAGQLVYDRTADDLCEVKGPSTLEGAAIVWHGARDVAGKPVLKGVRLDTLYVVKTTACRACAGDTRWEGRRGATMRCKQCEGLRRVPTSGALAPFRKTTRGDR